MVLKTKLRSKLANAVTCNANANLAVGNRPPTFGNLWIFECFFEALDRFLGGADRLAQANRRSNTRRPQKCSPSDSARSLVRSRASRGRLEVVFGDTHSASMRRCEFASSRQLFP